MPDNTYVEQKPREHGILPLWLFSGWLLMAGLSWLWGRAPTAFDGVRKLVINVLVIGPILLIIYMVQLAVREELMIVDAFSCRQRQAVTGGALLLGASIAPPRRGRRGGRSV